MPELIERTINRQDAIKLLSDHVLATLSASDRKDLLLSWWSLDESDAEYSALSVELRKMLKECDEPKNVGSAIYDPLLRIALAAAYHGVTNSFLKKELADRKIGNYDVSGVPEPLEVCPCCSYRTLSSVKGFEICPACHWEFTGYDQDAYSAPNRSTLKAARQAFVSSGKVFDKWVYAGFEASL